MTPRDNWKRTYGLPAAWVVAILVAAVAVGWPLPQSPRMYPDSAGYLGMSSERMPVYSLLASVLRPSYALVCLQFVLSLAAWTWLGHTIGRAAGALLGACFALALPIYVWNLVVLSESLTLSLMAALLTATIKVYRSGGNKTLVVWCVLAVLFATTHLINMLILPFLLVPFAGKPGLGRKPFAVMLAVVSIVLVIGVVHGRTAGAPLRDTSLVNIYMRKIAPIKENQPYFVTRGMPIDESMRRFFNKTGAENKSALFEAFPSFERWFRERGSAVYLGWILGRRAPYVTAWKQMTQRVNETFASFSAGTRMRSLPRWLKWFYRLLYVPYWIWLFGLVLPPLSWCVRGRAGPGALLVVALMAAAYVQAFVGYHADATELARHMITAFVLYKIASVLIVVGFVQISLDFYRKRRAAGVDAPISGGTD
jgi:hypothetical protein